MGRRRTKFVIPDVQIIGLADRGRAVGKNAEGQVLFVEDVVPGDVVDVLVLRKKKGYFLGIPNRFLSLSPERVEARCTHFEDCGGCKWQHFSYQGQLDQKQQIVRDAMRRIGKISIGELQPILPAPDEYHYRNKMEFSFSRERWKSKHEIKNTEQEIRSTNALGLHPPGFFNKVIDIYQCHLMHPRTDEIRNTVRQYAQRHNLPYYDPIKHNGLLRNLIVRHTTLDEWMLLISFAHDSEAIIPMLDELQQTFEFNSLHYVVNQKHNDTLFDQDIICHAGVPYIKEKLGDLTFIIRPKSFFQTNSKQAHNLYSIVRDFAELAKEEIVYDLYTGTGSIALFLADACKQIIGVEEVEDAILDARHNREGNNVRNTHFYIGDVKNVFTTELFEKHGKPDVVIADPPRNGMHKTVCESILAAAPSRIVYISCNPATQARDLQRLDEKYEVKKMRPVDMFPHTNHIENVALLVLR